MIQKSIYPNDFLYTRRVIRKNSCFVAMEFGTDTDEIYKTVQRAAAACNITCERSDDLKKSVPFINNIISSINSSYFIIVDISRLNPNVLYELGIAHTLRSLGRVLILKDSTTTCPSDLMHITYFSYEKGKYSELYDHVLNFLKNNSKLDDLADLFVFFNLVEDEADMPDVMNDVRHYFGDYSSTLADILNNNLDELPANDITFLMKKIQQRLFQFNEEDEYSLKHFYLHLAIIMLKRTINHEGIEEIIGMYFMNNEIQKDKFLLEVQAEIGAITIKLKYIETVFRWVKKYLMQISPAIIDVTKFKIQIALIDSQLPQTESFLLTNLRDNVCNFTQPVFTLVEHLLNLCKEKGLLRAIEIAQQYIKTTDNEFVFRSAFDLIVQLGTMQQILDALKISTQRSSLIEKSSFLDVHIKHANQKIEEFKKN